MTQKYSQEEINQILLTKQLNEFYLVIIENRPDKILTDEEYEEIIKGDIKYFGDNKESAEKLISKVKKDERLGEGIADEVIKLAYSLAQIRHMSIITMIDDEAYNIMGAKFEDLKRNKIIHYENLTNYYDDTSARIKVFTPKDEPLLKEDTTLLDLDDDSLVFAYEENHIHQEESEDLTSEFFTEYNSGQHTLKKTK